MSHAHNVKAAELHEATARTHRIAAEHFSKSKPDVAKAHASKALMQSKDAHEASMKAQLADPSTAQTIM